MVVTKGDLRHGLFLRMAKEALGDNWTATCVQVADEVSSVTGRSFRLRHHAVKFARHLRKLARSWFSRSDNQPADRYMQEALNIAPLPDAEIPGLFKTADPNSPDARAYLLAMAPDIVLVYGASILRHEWLTAPRLGALNMHYGILPWYRSTNSTQFALLHERPDRIGATVHYIDAGIDTGSIVRRFNVSPDGHSTLNELIASVYIAGARGLISCAKESIASRSKLVGTSESSAHSLYLAKCGTANVMQGARWRLAETSSQWPCTEAAVERFSLKRPAAFRLSRRSPFGVYILLYHSLTNPSQMKPWEKSYDKISTHVGRFAEHINFLISEGFEPLPLTEAPEVLRTGTSKKRYFVVTFDDAYSNISTVESFLNSQKVIPTVFVNGAFCEGTPYFRVLASILRDSDGMPALRAELQAVAPQIPWSNERNVLFNQTKNHYIPGKIEAAVCAAYSRVIGNPAHLRCHLDAETLRALRVKGWQIGNHTWEHMTLSTLSPPAIEEAIEKNIAYLRSSNLQPIDWLSYPNGLASHVNSGVKAWLDRNPSTNGIFAGGGVNLIHARTQWLRISIGNPDLTSFKRIIGQNTDATLKAIGLH